MDKPTMTKSTVTTSSASSPPKFAHEVPKPVMKLDLSCNSEDDIQRIITSTTLRNNDSATNDIVDDMDPLSNILIPSILVSPNMNSFECDYGTNGIRPTRNSMMALLETNSTISNLQDHYSMKQVSNYSNVTFATGLTLELWMTPSDVYEKTTMMSTKKKNYPMEGNYTTATGTGLTTTSSAYNNNVQSLPVFTIGYHRDIYSSTVINSYEEPYEDYIGCYGYDLLLAQRGNLLEVSYQDDDVAQSCRFLLVPHTLVTEMSLQVVLILSEGQTSIYFNGMPIIVGARNFFQTNLISNWNQDYRIQLFSNYISTYNSTYFSGAIHQVSMYDEPLNEWQIQTAFREGWGAIQNVTSERPLHLVASTFNTTVLVQGRTDDLAFKIGGFNASKPDGWYIVVEITSLPLFGSLRSVHGPVVSPGYRIPLAGASTHTHVLYDAYNPDYFTVPSSSFGGIDLNVRPELFMYRLVAVDAKQGDKVLGTSEEVTKTIHVVHVNHPPKFHSLSAIRVMQDTSESKGIRWRPKATVTGLQLLDSDQNIDRVRVDIWAWNGTITIQDDYLALTDFESCADRNFSPWQCFGDGSANRNMTFLAEPDDASLILSNLQYDAFSWNTQDMIVVRVFDGIGGPCLDEQEHLITRRFTTTDNPIDDPAIKMLRTIHDGCYEITANIEIPPMGMPKSDGDVLVGFAGFEEFQTLHIIFWVAVTAVCLGFCYCIPTCIKCLGRRGRRIFPDDINYVGELDQYGV